MPNQGKIINMVNLCLKQKGNIDFTLNKKGICAGLAALYIKYASGNTKCNLERKTESFFHLLDQLANLPSTYRIGDNPALDNFIIKIEKTFRADEYSYYEVLQSDVEKILDVGNKPLRNEFNLGLVTTEAHWNEIFKKITRDNRSYSIFSNNHAITLSIENGKYIVYDPNYNRKTKEFETADDLIKEIKDCFEYKDDSFGLAIRAFAHPDATPEHYPSHDELHQISFASQADTDSSFFAAIANDTNTLEYLFKQNKISYDKLTKEYFRPEFNNLLMQQPKSPILKKAVLRGIQFTLFVGNIKETEKLIDHYLKTYTTVEEQEELKNELQMLLDGSVKQLVLLMKREADYTRIIKLFEQLNLIQQPKNQTIYNHLQLLTFIKQEIDSNTLDQFLSKLSPEQIIKQIQCAAIANQHHVLHLLFKQLINAKISPESFPSIFNQEVIQEINVTTLKKLLDKGFMVNLQDPDLLAQCMQRNDKTIFETYAHAWLAQSNSTLWEHIDKREYDLIDLSTPLGSITLLNALIFLRKNEHIKKAWRDNIPEEILKSALTVAILNGNKEMSLFLQEKLQSQNGHLEQDTLEFLYTKGLKEEDLSILDTLTQLKFNVLHKTEDIRALLMLCFDYEDYSIIENCFANASPKIKKLILEYSLNWNIAPVIAICAQKAPQLFNDYLNASATNTRNLAKLNRVMAKIPSDVLSLNLEPQEQKKRIKDLFKNKLPSLAKTLFSKVTWEEEELDEFLNELIQDRNENGIKLLLQLAPTLKQRPKLITLLAQNNLLLPMDSLLDTETVIIDPELTEQIFTSALANNNKSMVARFLSQGRITPSTPLKQPIVELLKQTIEKGNDSVLEPFIESKLNFGLDFKELFLFSCAQKQTKIANQLLTKELTLSTIERKSAIQQLFGDQPIPALFDKIYEQGYGRLYQLVLKTNVQNPRASLLNSIQNPEQDPSIQSSTLYLNLLKRAVKEKNEKIFNTLFSQSDLPSAPSKSILDALKDPILFASVFPLFEKKYSLQKLLAEALQQKEWATLANLLENKKLTDLDKDLQQPIQDHGADIIKAYTENLEAHYDKTDVRPKLFQLLNGTNPQVLTQLALPYREGIQKSLGRVELKMLEDQLDLNNQIYRYTFDNLPVKQALEELAKIFAECKKIINEQNIDLDQPIENLELVNHLAQIKIIMAGKDISPDYLSETDCALLEQLIENPRFKQVCQLEFKLHCLLRQFQRPLLEQNEAVTNEFHEMLRSLREGLALANLPEHFVLPEIQRFFPPKAKVISPEPEKMETKSLPSKTVTKKSNLDKLKKSCTDAVDHYLKHRDQTLSNFSYFFDYYRGQIRANHYKNLIRSAQTEQELRIIEYAILVNDNTTQLKKDLMLKLGLPNEKAARKELEAVIRKSFAEEELPHVDALIDSINQKVNGNNRIVSKTLFKEELDYLKQIGKPQHQGSMKNYSFFNPAKQNPITGFWQWIVSWLSNDSSSTIEHKLSTRK
ncbi:hypothetical protein OQJ19_00890 [Fluoribacter gormanii]|uniref:hypothetical protein n=1 Tax=Fluoribacter gormanii TaxID=464 RepID=UPI002243D183|nr:hypothetical protein [Fluoribacter gormanii]MCW8469215.1 hypothetical protein [Fluoribacter gormanii]